MRLFFLNWSGKDLGMIEVVRALKKEHDVVYWTCSNVKMEVDAREFPGTILHEHTDALHGIPPEGFLGDIPPADPELLRALSEAEVLTLTMMNKHFERKTVSERVFLYQQYVAYWDAVLKKYAPDAIIFPTIPHSVYDFVVYSLAKHYGIRTVMFEPTWVGDRMIGMRDYVGGPSFLRNEKTISSDVKISELSADIRKEYERHLQTGTDATPVFVKNIKRRYSGIRLLYIKCRSLVTSISVHKDFSVLWKALLSPFGALKPNLKKEYEGVAVPPDVDKPFVYVPLHYQPERNSSPQGGIFVDQLYLVATLASSLPDGWSVYVKEHPTQWFYRGVNFFSYRFRGYYEALAKIKNVRVVPLTTNTYTLTSRSRAVATITGTAGFEAVLREKPVLVFGYPWYRGAPGLFEVNNLASCREALKKIAGGFTTSTNDVLRYLHLLDAETFHGYIDRDGQTVSSLSPLENAESLTREIAKLLKD
ncbi:MAG: hypothetical protein Q7R64_00375 [bacterium]|nr:hypothetical protein [bacterium]